MSGRGVCGVVGPPFPLALDFYSIPLIGAMGTTLLPRSPGLPAFCSGFRCFLTSRTCTGVESRHGHVHNTDLPDSFSISLSASHTTYFRTSFMSRPRHNLIASATFTRRSSGHSHCNRGSTMLAHSFRPAYPFCVCDCLSFRLVIHAFYDP